LRTLRTAKKLSQESIAEKLGLSVSGYAKIERGESDISIVRLAEIADVFEIKASDLLQMAEKGMFFLNCNNSGNQVNIQGSVELGKNIEEDKLQDIFHNLQTILTSMTKRIDWLENK
jgi:transcriptional regulator with XRE-family HTH domain